MSTVPASSESPAATAQLTYFYKLIEHTALPPDPLPDKLPVSSLDQQSGFVHLSTAAQIPGTLRHFFTDVPLVFVARLPCAPLENAGVVRWEDPEGKVCGRFRSTGIRPKCAERISAGGTRLRLDLFDHVKEVA